MEIDGVLQLAKELEHYQKTNKLEFYTPYPFQKEFHHARGHGEFAPVPSDRAKLGLAIHRALMCANQVGKTFCGSMETAMHLTGWYPAGWEGHRFKKPVRVIVGSNTNETARDICQRELFGDPSDENMQGTGSVPKKCIVKTNRKPGVNNAFDSVLVKHVSGGNSEVYFRAYEQGPKKFMGHKYDFAWTDEEPPQDIWAQILRSMFSTNGVAAITFTPEEGVTEVVYSFMSDLKPGQALIRATWDDAPHMTEEFRAQKLAAVPVHEREMRSRGIPLMGSGLVFPVPDEILMVEPFAIPPHWARLNAVDFGWDHPFACASIAVDRDSDTVYVYDGYKESRALIPVHCDAIKKNGDWIPVSWPHDGLKHDPKSGRPMAELYRDHGVNMLRDQFTNPPSPGEEEGRGGNSVEYGVIHMLEMMETGRFKVFSNVTAFWEEKNMYHRKDGKIVKLNEDFITACRYATLMRRFATTMTVTAPKQKIRAGMTNW